MNRLTTLARRGHRRWEVRPRGVGAFIASLLVLAAFGGLATTGQSATTFTVNSTADPGVGGCDAAECTLREAITAANGAAGADNIHFSIAGTAPHTIQPTSALPTITDPVTIDGTTQPGFSGAPIVEISGASAPIEVAGLKITAGSSTVRGLVINRFIHGALNINSPDGEGIVLETGDGNVVEGNYLGTDVTGTLDLGNHTGIRISSASTNNRIGGATSAARNVIGGNNRFGIYSVGSTTSANLIEGNYIGVDVSGSAAVPNLAAVNFNFGDGNTVSGNVISGNAGGAVIIGAGSNNVVQGNMIGTNPAGTAAIPNGFGVQILGGGSSSFPSSNNLVGGSSPGQGNVISGNTNLPILLNSFSAVSGSTGNRIEGNRIGVSTTGAALGNGTGVSIGGVGGMNNTTIGGTAPGAGNIIGYNGSAGVSIATGNVGELVLGNSIYANNGLGIDLDVPGVTPNDTDDPDSGANNLQNFPLLTGATTGGSSSTITGSLNSTPSTTFRIEFFANSSCDPSGNGEGQLYLGADSESTDSGGDVSFSSSVPTAIPSGWVVAATATDPGGNTSEFSPCTGGGVPNQPPAADAGGPYAGNEGAAIALDGTVSDPDGDSLATSWAYAPLSGVDAGASCSFGNASAVDTSITCTDDGSYTVTLTASDGTNPPVSDSATVVVANVAPGVNITTPSNGASFAVSATVNVSATLSDDGTNDTHTCSIDWDDTSSSVGSVSESSGSGTCSGSHAYAAPGSYTIEVTVTDDDGDSGSDTVTIEVADPNDPPTVDAGGPYAGNEGAAIALDGTVSDPDGDSLTTGWSYAPLSGVDAGASCSFGSASAVDTTITCTDDGSYTVTLTANDGTNPAVSDSATVVVGNVAPMVNITAPADGALYQINTAVNVSASFSDAGTNDTHTCSVNWENGTSSGSVSESSGSGTCSASRTYSTPGVYTIEVTVTDDDGAPGRDSVMIIVYDPSGGFVTGGGWIDSPAGALTADPSATGRANFGFVSKYKKGATVPEGQTEFQFQAGSLNFHSSSYQWLVVNQNGCRAQFKGTGTVNGSGSYGFMLWATDGNCKAEPGPDKFRIKIWNGSNESAIVYDNGSVYPNGQPLGGGSVVVHVKK